MTPFLSIAAYALLPALALTVSGVWASFYPLGRKAKSAILHFAAGVIFSVVAVEILPQVVKYHDWLLTTLGFGGAIGMMLLIRQVTEGGLGVGFAAGAKEGKLLAYALGIESISLGLATAATLRSGGSTRGRSIGLLVGIALVFLISAIGGATLLHNLSPTGLDLVLSFRLAALLFLVTEELLQEAHLTNEPAWLTATFYVGFLLFLLLGMLV